MAVAWLLCSYKRSERTDVVLRNPYVLDYMDTIRADGGKIAFVEVMGDTALCKVQASAQTIATIVADTNIYRVPKDSKLDDTLADLTVQQRNAIAQKVRSLGYTNAELIARFPNGDLTQVTMRQILKFIATKRIKPRYDKNTNQIIFDGDAVPCGTSVDKLDSLVPDGLSIHN